MRRYTFGLLVLLASGFATAAEKELHVVAAHVGHAEPRGRSQPGVASVTVDRPGKEVVLVVSAYNPVAWEVKATPKTTIKRVLAIGYHRQSVNAPKGVEVEELTHDGVKDRICTEYIYGYYNIDAARLRPFVQKLADRTGLEIASFQGTYQFDPNKPFVVDAIQKDERLSSAFPKLTPAAQVPKFKIEATRVVYGERRETWSFGAFTEAGPATSGFKPMPDRVRTLAYVPKQQFYYGITDHDFCTVEMRGGTVSKIPRPDNQFSWPQSLTYDAKRDRVLISTRTGGLYEYIPKNGGAWARLVKENHPAMVWQAKTDTLFAFRVGRAPRQSEVLIPTLCELNVNGTVAKSTAIESPLFPGILGDYGMHGHAQLIDLGGDLALLVHSENRDTGTGARGKPEAFLYVIDPKTGKVKLTWKE